MLFCLSSGKSDCACGREEDRVESNKVPMFAELLALLESCIYVPWSSVLMIIITTHCVAINDSSMMMLPHLWALLISSKVAINVFVRVGWISFVIC